MTSEHLSVCSENEKHWAGAARILHGAVETRVARIDSETNNARTISRCTLLSVPPSTRARADRSPQRISPDFTISFSRRNSSTPTSSRDSSASNACEKKRRNRSGKRAPR